MIRFSIPMSKWRGGKSLRTYRPPPTIRWLFGVLALFSVGPWSKRHFSSLVGHPENSRAGPRHLRNVVSDEEKHEKKKPPKLHLARLAICASIRPTNT